jgi:EAL domain-containing protein (putative c-di-GMP-specific phosphodiesterase class I)
MSINVSLDQLQAPDFATDLSLALNSHQVEPADLVLEVAERDFGGCLDAANRTLAEARELGVRVALDGFGTGATSLSHLRRLPVDILKIDQSLFVEPPGVGGPATPILDVVVDLSQRLGLQTIAHGLESASHLTVVRTAGCRYGQGFVYGQPAPAERAEAALSPVRIF